MELQTFSQAPNIDGVYEWKVAKHMTATKTDGSGAKVINRLFQLCFCQWKSYCLVDVFFAI